MPSGYARSTNNVAYTSPAMATPRFIGTHNRRLLVRVASSPPDRAAMHNPVLRRVRWDITQKRYQGKAGAGHPHSSPAAARRPPTCSMNTVPCPLDAVTKRLPCCSIQLSACAHHSDGCIHLHTSTQPGVTSQLTSRSIGTTKR
jgi:hypothetical protein